MLYDPQLSESLFMKRLFLCALMLWAAGLAKASEPADDQSTGVLLLAHGHNRDWNRQVETMAARLPFPVEVALGMAHKSAMAEGVRRLEEKGVRRIVAVPLYISSYSSIIRASAYLLGLEEKAPPELEVFNRMSHGLQNPHPGHAAKGPVMDLSPIRGDVPVYMTSAMDDHPLVGEILLDRARSISKDPGSETVILVGHGPDNEADDRLWQDKMNRLAALIAGKGGFAGAEAVTVMDDAVLEARTLATARLRARVEKASGSGSALVVPLLLSRGGIEESLQERLRGLQYRMPAQFLLPDPRIVEWVKQQVEEVIRKAPPGKRPR